MPIPRSPKQTKRPKKAAKADPPAVSPEQVKAYADGFAGAMAERLGIHDDPGAA